MAEGSEGSSRDVGEAGVRSDWFARALGPDWVEVEPGIFEHRPGSGPTEPAPPAASDAWAPLDEHLLERLPNASEKPTPEPEPEPEPGRPGRSIGR